MTTVSPLKPNPASRKLEKAVDPCANKIRHLVQDFNIEKFYELSVEDGEAYSSDLTDNISHTLYIAEGRRQECPKVRIMIAGEEVDALVDTGCELSILNECLYNKLKHAGLSCPELPTQHVNLVSAFNEKSKRIKKQALLEVKIGSLKIVQVVLLSAQLLTEMILGIDFLTNYEAEISFPERRLTLRINEEKVSFRFAQEGEGSDGRSCDLGFITFHPQSRYFSTAVYESQWHAENFAANDVEASVQGRRQENDTRTEVRGCFVNDGKLSERQLNVESETVKQKERGKCLEKAVNALRKNNANVADCDPMRTIETCLKADHGKTPQVLGANKRNQDDRAMTKEQLRDKISGATRLTTEQQENLYEVLVKYQGQLTKRPGKCTLFEYEFKIEGNTPQSAGSRPIPFALRGQIREQIREMLRDGILEESHSAYFNPITPVVREGKPVRICLDARRVNKQMIADHTKVMPMRELLQRFFGARYFTSLDLSSAFLQIPLEPGSRGWTAFQFEGKIYQFTTVPYGFKNSLAAFIRALEKVLGNSGLDNNLVMYVDDLLIHSSNFTEHLHHLDLVLEKLTNAGFTVNAAKCQFCKPEIKFLGHIISGEGVRADGERIEAILRYPTPKNQRQLRKFLGVCNFHQQFILNYSLLAEPLLVLLRKGVRWRWTPALQQAFMTLKSKFAHSILLIHPDENKEWIINTDASGRAIGSVLLQERDDGGFNIVSTASRVLNQTEQRYTTCEKELLAIVYALQRFRIYVYGRKVTLFTDNKALSFLHRCVITSNRVARWMIQLQEYDLDVRHISGAQNHLADILSRNPSGMTEEQTRNMTQPDQVMVHRIQVYRDQDLKKELKALADLQDTDERLVDIKSRVIKGQAAGKTQFVLQDQVLYCRGGRTEQRYKAMLPSCLEQKILKFVHCSLGHLGVDKCVEEIKYVFHVRNLGRKVRKFIANCDLCQRCKHPNRSFTIEERPHLPEKPGDVCAIDIYGSLPTSRGGVRYILVCHDVFSRYIKLYPLKSATTQVCLNKLINRYFSEVVTPKCILSDNATQFRSPSWSKKLQQHGVSIRFTPIRHPESNPSERCMRELSKFCRIYCNENHRKWAELLPHIENWMNNSVCSSTGYTPRELMYGNERQNVFKQAVQKESWLEQEEEGIEEKIRKAYEKMKRKAVVRAKRRRKGNAKWNPEIGKKVLVKTQPMSDAAKGITSKFLHLFQGPYVISKDLGHSAYELKDEHGKIRGEFNKKQLKQYNEEPHPDSANGVVCWKAS